jgi:hypothetical protein
VTSPRFEKRLQLPEGANNMANLTLASLKKQIELDPTVACVQDNNACVQDKVYDQDKQNLGEKQPDPCPCKCTFYVTDPPY